ncbi:MAG: polysaccharide deacetylase family protein [Brevefilum sp.]|nr:polysaccharide deacetylase family protein [Brevefilum sp.]
MILLYHLVFPDSTPKNTWNAGKVLRLSDFKKHLRWLKKRFKIVSLDDYITALGAPDPASHGSIAITFDDGYRGTFDLVRPVLLADNIPATFFVTTAHLHNHDLLWFVYFNALCFERVYRSIIIEDHAYPLESEKGCYLAWRKLIDLARSSGDAIAYSQTYAKRYPLPQNIIQKYLGLTEAQIASFAESPILELGGHTHSHPYLDQISRDDQDKEINLNKRILEEICGHRLRYFAYTGGVYNAASLEAVKAAGFEAACAVQPNNLGDDERFELPRTDIYAPALLSLKMKALGWVDWLKTRGFGVG